MSRVCRAGAPRGAPAAVSIGSDGELEAGGVRVVRRRGRHQCAHPAAAHLPASGWASRPRCSPPVRLLRRRPGARPASRRPAVRPSRPPPGGHPRHRALGARVVGVRRGRGLAGAAVRARFLQGVVSGVVFSVGSAWVGELSLASGEGAGGRRAAFAMTAGFSLGPLTSGLLGEFGPAPTVLALPAPHRPGRRRPGDGAPLPETVDLTPAHERRRAAPGPGPADPRRGRAADGHGAGAGGRVRLRVPVRRSSRRCRCWSTCPGPGWPSPAWSPGSRSAPARSWPAAAPPRPVDCRRRRHRGRAGYAAATAFATTEGCRGWRSPLALLGAGGGLCLAAGLTLTARLAAPSRRGALTALFLASPTWGSPCPFLMRDRGRHVVGDAAHRRRRRHRRPRGAPAARRPARRL